MAMLCDSQTGDVHPVLAAIQGQDGILRGHRNLLLARRAAGQLRHPQLQRQTTHAGTSILTSAHPSVPPLILSHSPLATITCCCVITGYSPPTDIIFHLLLPS